MKTLLLDIGTWDLILDASGNIAVAEAPYAVAQDVACAIKLFLGELWYDTTRGVPYYAKILGRSPPPSLFREYMVAAALSVPDVASAVCVIESVINRTLTGSVNFVDKAGRFGSVALTPAQVPLPPLPPAPPQPPTPPSGSSWLADDATVTVDSSTLTADS